jgi:NadR type nicotinamide-nucleotide adenylyltransferase
MAVKLTIGKFYPPHLGHMHLIQTMIDTQIGERRDFNVVIVLGNRFESITVKQRADWIREHFEDPVNLIVIAMPNDCPEDYNSEEIWFAQVELMRHALLNATGRHGVDVVFSSESYGTELAEKFNAKHILVDINRDAFKISGTAVRDNLDENWKMMIPEARHELATRIIVLGAESSGTTTLTKGLTEHYRKQFPSICNVPEYGRTFTESWLNTLQAVSPSATMEDLDWKSSDFDGIASVQMSMENTAAQESPIVIADTDSLATSVWHERYTGIEKIYPYVPHRDLYIITDHRGVDFHDDGFRDGEHLRAEMTEDFKRLLTKQDHSWILATGDHERRMKTAIATIDQIIEQNMTFTSPNWAKKTVLS